MNNQTTWILDRIEAVGSAGMVAAKHPIAAEVGADVLRHGGNAIDAAVTMAFVVGVVEPFMSGIGGGGFLVAHFPDNAEGVVVDYSMVAPRAAAPDMYPLVEGKDSGLFGWPSVERDANIVGYRSIAVPGAVAGLALSLERFGTMSLDQALKPAIRHAEEGFPISWHTTLMVSIDLQYLNQFPATREIFTNDGLPPSPMPGMGAPLRQPDLARTLRLIAADGPSAFYEGEIAQAIASDIQANDGLITGDDLRSYRAEVTTPLRGTYRAHDVLTTPTASGGPSVLETLNLMEQVDLRALGHNSGAALHHLAECCRQAFVDRFAYLADPATVDVPIEHLISKDYAAEAARSFESERARSVAAAGDRKRLGVRHDLSPSEPGYGQGQTTTTHISVIDKHGNAVSLTQTLLGGWGSRVVVPGTGVLLNNGMMWFDPEPGRPNSVGPFKKPLANMAPVVLLHDDHAMLSLGAMGGRKILNAVPQIISNIIDHDMGIQAAITAPRIDYSTRSLMASSRIPAEVLAHLRALGHPVEIVDESPLSFAFASPVGVLSQAGRFHGGANPYYPAMAIGVSQES